MLGGVSTAVETTRRLLARLGHTVIVVAPRMAGTPETEAGIVRVPAVPAPTYPDFSLPLPVLPGLARSLASLAFDVIHAQHPFLLGRTALTLARRSGTPFCFTYHTLYDKYAHYVPLPRPVVVHQAVRWSTRFANAADLVIAPSEALATRLAGQGVRRPIAVLPTGVDGERFQPGDRLAARMRLGLPPDATLLLYVGRLDREKNLELLLTSLTRVVARRPEAHILMVGRGTRTAALQAEAVRLGLGARVSFVGGVLPAEVTAYYQAADLFAFASTTETQGLAVLEAMATGLPVVAVRASGTDEAVVDGVSGLLVPEDPEAFARAVDGVLSDPGLATKLSEGAREAAQRFAAPTLIARLVELYRGLIDKSLWPLRQ
jgi:glycosyltransferase involved in cell wall biosynthesis